MGGPKNLRLAVVIAALASAAFMSGTAQAANIVTNGSFENLTNFVNQGNDTDEVYPVDSTTMPGWTVISNDISWIGPSNPFSLTAADGSYFLDLTGYHNGVYNGGLEQTLNTSNGATYLLTFDLGSSSIYGLQNGILASAGSTSQSFTSTNNGSQTNLWQTESLAFTATGSSTLLSFVGNSGDNYDGLDDVSVVQTSAGIGAVPEPATWAMFLVGFGAIGFMMRGSRRKQLGAVTVA